MSVVETNTESLQSAARRLLHAAVLPRRAPDKVCGGPGIGAQCILCTRPITRDENEFEIEFDPGSSRASTLRFHTACFAVWDEERRLPVQGSKPP
jgi:hypothetical protein